MSDKQHRGKDGPESCTRASKASLQAPSQILQLLYIKDFTSKARKLLITTKTMESWSTNKIGSTAAPVAKPRLEHQCKQVTP
jgi:hypothetical protein